LTLVKEQDGSEAFFVDLGGEALLELAQEVGIGADGLEPADGCDLAAHVALGQVGDLDLVDSIAGFGEAGLERS